MNGRHAVAKALRASESHTVSSGTASRRPDDGRINESGLDHAARIAEDFAPDEQAVHTAAAAPSGRNTSARTRRPSSCCASAGSRAPQAVRRWLDRGVGRRSRFRGCRRCWCRGRRRCARTELGARRAYRVGKAVLLESELRQPVVATVERGEIGAQRFGVESRDLGDHRVELHRLEAARRERRAALRQRLCERVDAATEPVTAVIGEQVQHESREGCESRRWSGMAAIILKSRGRHGRRSLALLPARRVPCKKEPPERAPCRQSCAPSQQPVRRGQRIAEQRLPSEKRSCVPNRG